MKKLRTIEAKQGSGPGNGENELNLVHPYLCVSVHRVSHPTTGLHLISVQAPELELFFKQGTAYVSWVVKLSRPERVRVQDFLPLSKWSRDIIILSD